MSSFVQVLLPILIVADFFAGGTLTSFASVVPGLGNPAVRAIAFGAAYCIFRQRQSVREAVTSFLRSSAGRATLGVATLMIIGAWLRLSTLGWDIENGPEGYEALFISPVLSMMSTGSLNHRYHEYPGLLLYVLLGALVLTLIRALSSGLASGPADLPEGMALFSTRLVSAVGSVLSIPATFELGRAYAGPRAGLIAAALLTVSPMELRSSQLFRPDVLLELLCLLSLRAMFFMIEKPGLPAAILAGISVGVATSSKYSGFLLLIPLVGAAAASQGPLGARAGRAVAGFAAAPLAFLVCSPYSLLDLKGFLAGFGAQVAINTNQHLAGVNLALGYTETLRSSSLGGPVLVAALVGLGLALASPRRFDAVLIPWVAGYLAFFFRTSVEGERFLLPIAPVLMIYAGRAVSDAVERARSWIRSPALRAGLAAGLVLVLFAPLVFGAARLWLARHHPSPRAEAAAFLSRLPPGTRVAISRLGPRVNSDHLVVARVVAVDADNAGTLTGFDYVLASRVDSPDALRAFEPVRRFDPRPGGPGEGQDLYRPRASPDQAGVMIPPRELTLSASHHPADLKHLLDEDPDTLWRITSEERDRWLEIDLGRARPVTRISVKGRLRDSAGLPALTIWVSENGRTYRRAEPITTSKGEAWDLYFPGSSLRLVRFALADEHKFGLALSGLAVRERAGP